MSALLWIFGSLFLFRMLIKMDRGASGPKLPRKSYRKYFIAGLASALVLVPFLYGFWHLGLKSLTPDPLILKAFYHFLVVGPVEELSKFLVFFLLLSMTKSRPDPQSGMVMAGLTGLGFAVLENLYYIAAAQGNSDQEVYTLFRVFLVGPGHVIYAMIWGGYYSLEVWRGGGRVKNWGHILMALFIPIFAHGLYNTLTRVHIAAALISDLAFLVLALVIYSNFKALSPFRRGPVSEEELLQARAMSPESEEIHRRLTHFYTRADRWDDGFPAAKIWAQTCSDNPIPCFLASWFAWCLGENEKASSHLQKWNHRPHTTLEKYLRYLDRLLGKPRRTSDFSLWCRQTLFGSGPHSSRLGAAAAPALKTRPVTRWDPRRGRISVR